MTLKHFAAISAIVILTIVIVSAVVIITPRQDSLKFIQARSPPIPTNLNSVTLNHDNSLMFATNSSRPGVSLMIITNTNKGSFLGGATYSITPLSGSSNYTVKDDGPRDTNKAVPGIITIAELPNGNYTVTEVNSSQGYSVDKVSKIIEIKPGQNAPIATFTNIPLNEVEQNNNNSQIKSITYTAKFECGSIIGDEGPLRPGHYDTDISIFNRQEYPVKILLNALVNDGKGTNAIVKTLQPQTSTAITCKDLRQLFNIGNNSKEMVEGFVVIGVHFNNGVLGSLYDNGGSSTIITPPLSKDEINFLDVQVFYTANALETLPHEIMVDKITFSILNDTSKKIPFPLLTKTLNIDLQSQMNQISDPESKIKSVLAKGYNLSDHEVEGLKIKIIDVGIGVGTMIDDHAISSSTVRPQSST
jgi:Prealbumin-like fold domain